jgi:DNA-binding response OmpR family regulator
MDSQAPLPMPNPRLTELIIPMNTDTATGTHILLVQAESHLNPPMGADLQTWGYQYQIAQTVTSALKQMTPIAPALVVIDQDLGSTCGFELCRQLRCTGSQIPMLLLMAHDTVEDRVACLEAGADDYVLKPYQRETFLYQVRLYLNTQDPPTSEQLRFGNLVLDLASRSAIRDQRTIELTMKEFELLRFLMEHPRDVLSREQILDQVWGYDFMGESNVIEVYIRYLRLKLEAGPDTRVIHTVRGVGYVLREP